MFKKRIVFLALIFLFLFLPLKIKALKNIQNLKIGQKMEVTSNVLVLPGVLGKRYFYINGAQIYSHFKEFPDLKVGDKVEVVGEISKAHNEKRIKTDSKNDIKVLNKGKVNPLFFNLKDINKNLIGYLLQTKGQIIEKEGNRLFLIGSDKKAREQIVYLKPYTKIDQNRFKLGDKLKVIGILSKYGNRLELLPRSQDDIRVLERENIQNQGLTPGSSFFKNQASISVFWSIFNSYKIYFYISSFILSLILVWLVFLKP